MPLTSLWCSVFKCRSHLMAHFACFVLIKTVDRQCQPATQHYHLYAHPSLLPTLTEHTHTHHEMVLVASPGPSSMPFRLLLLRSEFLGVAQPFCRRMSVH